VSAKPKPLVFETAADLLEQLGDVPPERVRLKPLPGKATERDVIALQDHKNRNFELVDGVLVEKPVGFLESYLALDLSYWIKTFVNLHDLGILVGESGAMRLWPGLVRIPDVSFVSWAQLPSREIPTAPIPDLFPDLAVEVLSESNTKMEMDRKVKEYFLAGSRLVWLVDSATRSVRVYTAPDQSVRLTEGQTLDGGDVLPGLRLPLKKVFAKLPRRAAKPLGKKRTAHRKPRKNGST
jgi:Uma2 family endonuclease